MTRSEPSPLPAAGDPDVGAITRNPIGVAEVARAIVVIAAALGIATLDAITVTVVLTAGIVLVSFGASVWARLRVTPMVDPRDDDGMPLVRVDTGQPPRAAQDHAEQKAAELRQWTP